MGTSISLWVWFVCVCVCVHIRQVSTCCPEIREKERDIREVVEVLLCRRLVVRHLFALVSSLEGKRPVCLKPSARFKHGTADLFSHICRAAVRTTFQRSRHAFAC